MTRTASPPRLRLAEMIQDLDQEIREASRAGALARVIAAAQQRNALEERAALDFGAAYGWQLSWSSFGLATLALGRPSGCSDEVEVDCGYLDHHGRNLCEHPCWYRRGGKPAAIAAHLADWPARRGACEFLAAEFGLTLLVPDFPSWHSGATLVAYIGRVGKLAAKEIPQVVESAEKAGKAPQKPPYSAFSAAREPR